MAPVSADAVLQRLEWQVLRRVDGLLQGDHRSLLHGVGLDFADVRDYVVGDDVRHIDWNVTARLDSPHVRQFVEDRELIGWFLLDRSSSMGLGDVDRTKADVLTDFVTTMARLLTGHGNRVGAVLWDNRVETTVPARTGRQHVLRLTHELLRPASGGGDTTDLAGLLRQSLDTIGRRSSVFIVSDFLVEPGWERPLAMLAHRHEVVAVRVSDRRETELPDVGLVVLEDAETGGQVTVDTSDPGFRARLHDLNASHDQAVRQAVRSTGVDLVDVATDDDLVRVLVEYVEQRRRRFR